MTSPLNPFRSSVLWTDCEECRLRVNMSEAGACTRCRRVLCNRHLHRSFIRRLMVDVGAAEPVCVKCREGGMGKREEGN